MSKTSKQQILKDLRVNLLEAVDRPSLDDDWIRYDDRVAQFEQMLQAVGGNAVRITDIRQLDSELDKIEPYVSANRICSLLPDLQRANVDLETLADPHATEDIDFAVAVGEFAVAENGAVWVTDEAIKHRVLLFVAQHLALIVPTDAIVDNMHQAYDKLTFDSQRFGVFISGPSKTADIEQSLVIGARAARSMTVFLVDNFSDR